MQAIASIESYGTNIIELLIFRIVHSTSPIFAFFVGGMFQMVIVELIQILAKNNLMTYQMNSPMVFAYESDSYHRIFLELSTFEDRSVQISQMIKVYIKRKSSTEKENILQPSPQVTKMIHEKAQVNFNRKLKFSYKWGNPKRLSLM